MELLSNPKVRAEYENLRIQFGNKAMLDLDDYSNLFGICRRKASCHVHRHDVPHVIVGRTLYIPMQDLALHIARKKAASEGEIIAIKQSKEDIKNSRGFAKMAHDKQIYGSKRT